ncbi:MAG: hypothetical protein PHY47_09465 [Lachnospiraceae bacterium]|nr:hypothetical protein [Lachnospiraceae bacterium]
MDIEHKIVNLRDKDQSEVAGYFQNIEKENYKLSQFVMENLKKDSSIGIRDDVLRYISANASIFGEDQTYLFNIASFLNNLKVTAEHLAWVNDFFRNSNASNISIDDFGIVFIEAIERDIPLEKIKKLFLSGEDEVEIYEKVVTYVPGDPEEVKEQTITPINEEPKRVVVEQRQTEEPGYADVFGSLMSVFGTKNDESNAIHIANEKLNKMAANFQLATSEFAAYSSELIHEMETDKKEIERLTALMSLQQKMMNSQQNKINELRNEIVKLNYKIQEAEKTENQKDTINQKLSELANLTMMKRPESSGGYFLNE